MDGWKPKALKNKSFNKIQELFDKAMKRINTFVDFRTELVEEKRSKKQKVKDDKESEELKKCLEIIPDDGDDVTIDATPLSIKSPTIVDYKIYKEGKKNYFGIFKADGNSQMYLTEEEVVEVVTTDKMIIDVVVDVAQVTTAIVDIRPEEITTTKTAFSQQPRVQDKGKGKGKLIEEPKMPKKRKHQIRADEKLAEKLQAEMQAKIDKEDRLARERAQKKQEANDALINTWDDIQAKIDANAQLA
uniref:Uncharacterized protein n=1 Tax=Tanacetum cinerariifolium TaxID=118510 RepID=A0A6L2LS00_TANCI|nr:hypothetical protein [Tanacetum cinerariifolium]